MVKPLWLGKMRLESTSAPRVLGLLDNCVEKLGH